jgi:hypothetical protein
MQPAADACWCLRLNRGESGAAMLIRISNSAASSFPSPLRGGKLRAPASSRVGSSCVTPPGSRQRSQACADCVDLSACRSPPSPQGGGKESLPRFPSSLIQSFKQPCGIGPCFGQATGCLSLLLSPGNDPGERSAERRSNNSALMRRGTHLAIGASRLPALHGGDFCPRDRTSGDWTGFSPMIRRLSPLSSVPRPAIEGSPT